MSRPSLDPREHPEWMQREAEAVVAEHRRKTRRILAGRSAIAALLVGGAALGIRALMEIVR